MTHDYKTTDLHITQPINVPSANLISNEVPDLLTTTGQRVYGITLNDHDTSISMYFDPQDAVALARRLLEFAHQK